MNTSGDGASRRGFLLGALAGLAAAPRAANAQAVGIWHPPPPKKLPTPRASVPRDPNGVSPAPQFPSRLVNESVAALPAWVNNNARLVRRITMGVSATEMMRVSVLGYQEYLSKQLHPSTIDDSALDAVVAARWPLLSATNDVLFTSNSSTVQTQLQEATLYRAAFSERQLFERMVEFWSDHFNISIGKVGYLKVADDRDVIRANALGRFRDLLQATAKSPAMLAYLDQTQSKKGAPNQNYARELMELHTLGVDNGYTQTDVAELSRLLTGWTTTGTGTFLFNNTLHDTAQKTIMGQNFPADTFGGQAEGERFIDYLAAHPNTATFISTKLLRWLLQAEPTTAQITAVSRVFRATQGDIKLVVRAILNESWLAAAPAKFKRPFHFMVSALRATSAQVVSATTLNGQLGGIGQPLFVYETPDGYPDKVEYWSGNILPRWSFAVSLTNSNSTTTVKVDTAPYLTGTADAAVDRIINEFYGGEVSLALRTSLLTYMKGGTFNDLRVRETMSLALSAQAFQWY